MDFLSVEHTDIGIKKSTNQDAVLMQIANTDYGKVCFSVICDGMGGLAKGELASATVIRAFSGWFRNVFPEMLYEGFDDEELEDSWNALIQDMNAKIMDYGNSQSVNLGTTIVALLIAADKYYAVNVGDSRLYEITEEVKQITKDQTYVQREIDLGHMTHEQAQKDPKRNVLLQCVGASAFVVPEFFTGAARQSAVYMMCSDGFRHVITAEEIGAQFNPANLSSEEQMKQAAVYLTDLNKSRREVDNISVALVRTF